MSDDLDAVLLRAFDRVAAAFETGEGDRGGLIWRLPSGQECYELGDVESGSATLTLVQPGLWTVVVVLSAVDVADAAPSVFTPAAADLLGADVPVPVADVEFDDVPEVEPDEPVQRRPADVRAAPRDPVARDRERLWTQGWKPMRWPGR